MVFSDTVNGGRDLSPGETLVYDPTDALAASVDERRPSDERGFTVATRHLVGHFYIEFEASS